ncbi:uncharacterized protein B0H18DRAFT_1034742 [Fomitopsis serialis]|uniref:uncharacterized protein n=1 Tax=Fomitopsis serialis TaxID=139415 RepID=UPI002008DD61|nr:uncharacterized protein B0H18DRAFT_1034742 [Neoantrodia serialis]KAH9917451.1 hypothetical protein B0H18DRAFT_1034742 [Neoantrodia serialis]
MSVLSRSNGRPEPEVIVNFADGHAYSKGKMEEAFRNGFLDKPATKPKESTTSKREDVDLLVHELEITRSQAEKLLIEKNGDIKLVLQAWIEPTV